jgi:hypothetical protein
MSALPWWGWVLIVVGAIWLLREPWRWIARGPVNDQ